MEEPPSKTRDIANFLAAPSLPSHGRVLEHRMDRMNPGLRGAQDGFSDRLIPDGLILWCLSTPGQSDLWAMVFELEDGLYFVVDDDPEGPHPCKVHEHHADIVTLMDRAETLKGSLLGAGWVDVDVE